MVIPIFPLSIVQFPGVVTPLHIFEPRYQKLMNDIVPTGNIFGIIYPGEAGGELPEIGRAGCSVEVLTQQNLTEGRSNILCAGKERFYLRELIDGEPYYQAEVEFFEDDLTFEIGKEQLQRAKDLFLRIIMAGKRLRDMKKDELAQIPDLPDDPTALSFIIAASLDVTLDEKQLWLELTSTARRLSILTNHLTELVDSYELRAQIHQLSKLNGHSENPPELM